ncbi:protein ACCELERATED CELL DEATH 6-like [Durio zibethinus]|uniref:Protein ACCELERATED CELL DEATH 6-like n=1 Tax=Durio zibethinus TaxID=66656 RepID=A0A6P6A7Z6_DURZI|nr:protein ACCELERATED CELL DEATH 6-like [Durio zibethinus]
MDPSSSNSNPSEISVANQPDQPVRNISYMGVALYEAAGEGKIKEFENYGETDLKLLKTPRGNSVLHVYLATDKDRYNQPLSLAQQAMIKYRRYFAGQLSYQLLSQRLSKATVVQPTSFVARILEKCPSLLLQPNARGEIPLHIAARYGHSAVVEFLVKHAKALNGDPEQQGMEAARQMLRTTDEELNTPLHTAVNHGHLGVVRALLESEDPEFSYSANKSKETPLYIAARKGSDRLVAEILNKFKADAHGGPHGRTALHAAVMAGNREATRMILEEEGSLKQEPDEKGHTPLHYAAHLGHYSVVKELLKGDRTAAYIADKETEMTPLLMAARQGHERIVREIITSCPDCCEMVDKRGWNVLHFLSIRCSPYAADLFLYGQTGTAHASVANLRDEKDENGNTPLEVYIACGGFSLILPSLGLFSRVLPPFGLLLSILPPFGEYFGFSSNIEFRKISNNLSATKKVCSLIQVRNVLQKQIANLLEDVVDGEVAEVRVRPINKFGRNQLAIEKAREAHLVVAALIATVTFAAAITLPGGFVSEKTADDKGTAILIHNVAFQAFVVTDAVALVCSLVAVFMHFAMALPYFQSERSYSSLQFATQCTAYAVGAMVVAFSTGTYAVLEPSSGLAITTCCIGLSFFAILIPYFNGMFEL